MTLEQDLLRGLDPQSAGFCGAYEPAAICLSIADEETRLRALTLGAVFGPTLSTKRWQQIADLGDHWLLTPQELVHLRGEDVHAALKESRIGGAFYQAQSWRHICRGLVGRVEGRVSDLIRVGGDDAISMQNYLAENRATFPILAGEITSVHWLDLVYRIGGLGLTRWERLRTKLPPSLSDTALEFGIRERTVHPQIKAALGLWQKNCKK